MAPPAPKDVAKTLADAGTDVPEVPFDNETDVCIPDLRSIINLPVDAEEEAVQMLRAFIFKRGSVVHVPDAPGKYATTELWRLESALQLVHFKSEYKRPMELLVSFGDFGKASIVTRGVFITSLQLPLQKAARKFEDVPRWWPIEHVSGFTPITATAQPWCMMLPIALARLPMLAPHKLYTSKAMQIHFRESSLEARINELRTLALTHISTTMEAIARQDAAAAEKTRALCTSRMDTLLSFFQNLPYSAYDVESKLRVIELAMDAEAPDWLLSPMKKHVMAKTCPEVAMTGLGSSGPVRAEASPVRAGVVAHQLEAEVVQVAQPRGLARERSDWSDDNSSSDDQLGDTWVVPPGAGAEEEVVPPGAGAEEEVKEVEAQAPLREARPKRTQSAPERLADTLLAPGKKPRVRHETRTPPKPPPPPPPSMV